MNEILRQALLWAWQWSAFFSLGNKVRNMRDCNLSGQNSWFKRLMAQFRRHMRINTQFSRNFRKWATVGSSPVSVTPSSLMWHWPQFRYSAGPRIEKNSLLTLTTSSKRFSPQFLIRVLWESYKSPIKVLNVSLSKIRALGHISDTTAKPAYDAVRFGPLLTLGFPLIKCRAIEHLARLHLADLAPALHSGPQPWSLSPIPRSAFCLNHQARLWASRRKPPSLYGPHVRHPRTRHRSRQDRFSHLDKRLSQRPRSPPRF